MRCLRYKKGSHTRALNRNVLRVAFTSTARIPMLASASCHRKQWSRSLTRNVSRKISQKCVETHCEHSVTLFDRCTGVHQRKAFPLHDASRSRLAAATRARPNSGPHRSALHTVVIESGCFGFTRTTVVNLFLCKEPKPTDKPSL